MFTTKGERKEMTSMWKPNCVSGGFCCFFMFVRIPVKETNTILKPTNLYTKNKRVVVSMQRQIYQKEKKKNNKHQRHT